MEKWIPEFREKAEISFLSLPWLPHWRRAWHCSTWHCRDAEPEPEPEPPEHFVRSLSRSRSRLKRFGSVSEGEEKLYKRKRKTWNEKNVESIIFTAQFLPFSRTAKLSDLSGRAHCFVVAPLGLSGHFGLWYHLTVTVFQCIIISNDFMKIWV